MVVAVIALYATMTAGFQGALMVPTEILARQHMESLQQLLDPLKVRTALLTDSIRAKERRLILEELANSETDIVVGTHALTQQDANFHQLDLVVTDEQRCSGVSQRKVLRERGLKSDVLFMTATPISRTLAITACGETDAPAIGGMPVKWIPIETYWIRPPQLDTVLEWTEEESA